MTNRKTSHTFTDIQIEVLRQMTSAAKFQALGRIHADFRQSLSDEIRRRHPYAEEQECRLRMASLMIPADLIQKAFGWEADSADKEIDLEALCRAAEARAYARLSSPPAYGDKPDSPADPVAGDNEPCHADGGPWG